ncbi:MAG: acyltransferase family protein [Oscillospiraceae bacterium]|nr:acyltransferase family protein [Oscillospiraceae bacterium]
MEKRLYAMDNLRCFLIVSVLMGHFLEVLSPFLGSVLLYKTIYSFHMPLMIFLSGYFARFRLKEYLLRLLCPYLLFQVLYRLFAHCFLEGQPLSSFRFLSNQPYWTLWYLFVLLAYYLLTLLPTPKRAGVQAGLVGGSFLLALLVGYSSLGYAFSLSRMVYFLPFFLAGYYGGKGRLHERILAWKRGKSLLLSGLCALGAVGGLLWLCYGLGVTQSMFYGASGYYEGYTLGTRLLILTVAGLWCGAMMIFFLKFLNGKLPLLTYIGQNTLPLYLLHGFLVKTVGKLDLFAGIRSGGILALLALTAVTLLLCCNPVTSFLLQWPKKKKTPALVK